MSAHPSCEERTSASQKSSRARDLIFEALCTALGVALDDVPKSKGARGPWVAACRDLKADEATPEQIVEAGSLWPSMFPDARLTPTALAKHFPQLRGQLAAKSAKQVEACPDCGVGGGHTADCPRAS